MTPAPAMPVPTRRPAQASEVRELLSEAGRAKSLVLGRQELRGIEGGRQSHDLLIDALRKMTDLGNEYRGLESREIFGRDSAQELGDALAWVDAGSLYEALVKYVETSGPVDFIFCLDPWAAQLLSRAQELGSGIRWILVSDVPIRRTEGHPEYWDRMEEWFNTLPFFAIIPKNLWDLAISVREDEHRHGMVEGHSGRIHLESPGAWQWRRIGRAESSPHPGEDLVFFCVRYSGSLSHLKILLDSLARQDFPKNRLRAVILAREVGNELPDYLEWFGLVHADLQATQLSCSRELWETDLNEVLGSVPGACVVVVDDHALLPDRFAIGVSEAVQEKISTALIGIPLSLEVSAQIITGNLDPISNYARLVQAFAGKPAKGLPESARIIPPQVWNRSEGGFAQRILNPTQKENGLDSAHSTRGMGLLQLVDLP